ncbi:MAG: hypothetical protein IPK71_01275 [Myxococcales bacterium]|nr:hypothetical protein [Myxococcales bacterium]
MTKFRNNDRRIIAVAAKAAQLDPAGFFIEVEPDGIIVNHQESMKWPAATRAEVERQVKEFTGMNVWVT